MGNSYFSVPALWEQGARRLTGQKIMPAFDSSVATRACFLQEESFHKMLTLERRRAERSRKPFVLMVLKSGASAEAEVGDRFMSQVASVLLNSTRETDLVGWYKEGIILGVIFTEISLASTTPIIEILRSKVVGAVHEELSSKITSTLAVTVHLFPTNRDRDGAEPVTDNAMRLVGIRPTADDSTTPDPARI
jgi:GGDEF domain-containing protein